MSAYGTCQVFGAVFGRTMGAGRPRAPDEVQHGVEVERVCTGVGGVISPLLANIALSAVEERYERWVYRRPTRKVRTDGLGRARRAREYDRRSGRLVCFPIRYADDFVVLVHGSREQAEAEKNALAEHLRMTLGLELSAEKTRTIPITEEFVFLGHRIRLKWDRWRGYYTALEVPKAKAADLRYRIKRLTGRSTLGLPLARMLTQLNRIVRGWGYFYRHCHGAGPVFHQLDWYVDGRVWRWLKKKHGISTTRLLARYKRWSTIGRRKVWQDAGVEQFLAGRIQRGHYLLGWLGKPDYAMTSGEPDA